MAAEKYDNVIIFGPTGSVGGSAALEASKHAKVWLAMRNLSKPIDNIPAEIEKAGNFTRIQADLTNPTSLTKAIRVSGAKAAYLYLVSGTDYMRGALKALKDAGVEYIVFLSSALIKPGINVRDVPPEEIIPYAHAQALLFASNYINSQLDKSSKPLRAYILHLDAWADNIVPEDIGAVAGAVLTKRPSDKNKEVIFLYGPELQTAEESWKMIREITGQYDIDTTPMSKEELLQRLQKNTSTPLAAYLVDTWDAMRNLERNKSVQALAAANVRKYTGREATKFEDYLERHKAEWQAL